MGNNSITLQHTPAQADYKGDGEAWLAMVKGVPVAIAYNPTDVPRLLSISGARLLPGRCVGLKFTLNTSVTTR